MSDVELVEQLTEEDDCASSLNLQLIAEACFSVNHIQNDVQNKENKNG